MLLPFLRCSMGVYPPEVFRKITKIIRLHVKSRLFFGLWLDADGFSSICIPLTDEIRFKNPASFKPNFFLGTFRKKCGAFLNRFCHDGHIITFASALPWKVCLCFRCNPVEHKYVTINNILMHDSPFLGNRR